MRQFVGVRLPLNYRQVERLAISATNNTQKALGCRHIPTRVRIMLAQQCGRWAGGHMYCLCAQL